MSQRTLESLASMVGVLDESEVEQARKMIAARRGQLIQLKILSIPIGAEVMFRLDKTPPVVGQCLHHYKSSVLVRYGGSEITVPFNKIVERGGLDV